MKILYFYLSLIVIILFILCFIGCLVEIEKTTALGDPLFGLTRQQLLQFCDGKAIFDKEFTQETGLGPLFNASKCGECHESPVLGGVGDEMELHATKFTLSQIDRISSLCDPLFKEGGFVIQQHATPLLQAHGIMREELPRSSTNHGFRSTPPLFGLGLVDAIPEATILENEDPNDIDHDGISGKANRTSDRRVGKFGRKAQVATLLEFNTGAFNAEQSITTPLNPIEETINGVPVPPDTDPVIDPEISNRDIQRTNTFVQFLAPSPVLQVNDQSEAKKIKLGRNIFRTLKCVTCHIEELKTGPSNIEALNRKKVALYSDLLLHDMGLNLSDICLEQALPSEFRTEMLWGLRFRTKFLHDGRADSVRMAIDLHAGEAQRSRNAFNNLTEQQKQALLKFLGTI